MALGESGFQDTASQDRERRAAAPRRPGEVPEDQTGAGLTPSLTGDRWEGGDVGPEES